MTQTIKLTTDLNHGDLMLIAEKACAVLCGIANQLTTGEDDKDDTEEEFGLDMAEVVEMAHDNMIMSARTVLGAIGKHIEESAAALQPS